MSEKDAIKKKTKSNEKSTVGKAIDPEVSEETSFWEAGKGLKITKLQKVSNKLHSNYIKHRKAIFYKEYGIYARQRAIQQLRQQEEAEEIALKNYEYISNYTAESLDIFLRECEDAKNQASRVAEEKVKQNMVLTTQARDLTVEMSTIKSEIATLNDSLRECKFYMQFLDNVAGELMRKDEEEHYRLEKLQQQNPLLSPVKGESIEFIQKLRDEAHAQSLKAPMASRVNSILNMLDIAADQDDGFDEQALLAELNLVGGDEKTDKEELAGLVFTHPSQLLDVYAYVEEQNLSLIQHSQLNEETLEVLERQIRETRKGTEEKSRHLRDTINEIEAEMQKTTEQIETLNVIIEMYTGGYHDVKSQEKLMKLLRKHVNKLYKTCIGPNDQCHLSAVQMLAFIEKSFEDVIRDLGSIPADVVLKISKGLEKERREAERLEQQGIRQKNRMERVSRSLERAQVPIKPMKGRKIAFRSRPPKIYVPLQQKDLDEKAEQDEWNYYFAE